MPSERARILVVEDSPMMVRMYRLVLGGHFALAFAGDGAEGLDAAAVDPDVDLIVVDVNMPTMDGLEFIRRLRGELRLTEVPVLVCSTEASEADQQAARDAGGNEFLAKPWEPDALLASVRGLLGRAAA